MKQIATNGQPATTDSSGARLAAYATLAGLAAASVAFALRRRSRRLETVAEGESDSRNDE